MLIDFRDYEVPFVEPVRIGGRELRVRRGLIVGLTDEEGNRGEGEIAPLEGYSPETLKQARAQVESVDPAEWAGEELYPSVRFGLETAELELLEKKYKTPFPGYGVKKLKKDIRINGLLHVGADTGEAEIIKGVETLLADGFETIKLKVGRREVGEDIYVVNAVVRRLPPGAVLRLDANGLWDFDTALVFAGGLESGAKERIEYIEEPLIDPGRVAAFYQQTGLPTALDESLINTDPATFETPKGVHALVLKPTILGGVRRVMGFIGCARAHGLKAVISSCFEVGPGFERLIKLARAVDFDDSACGLDTMRYLASGGQGGFFEKPPPWTP